MSKNKQVLTSTSHMIPSGHSAVPVVVVSDAYKHGTYIILCFKSLQLMSLFLFCFYFLPYKMGGRTNEHTVAPCRSMCLIRVKKCYKHSDNHCQSHYKHSDNHHQSHFLPTLTTAPAISLHPKKQVTVSKHQ